MLDNLVDNGFMTEGQVYGARRNPATPVDRTEEDAPNYYLDWAFDRYAQHTIELALRQYGRDYRKA